MATKNNPKNRAKAQEKRKHNGREIEPVLLYKYGMVAKYVGSAEMVRNAKGEAILWNKLPA